MRKKCKELTCQVSMYRNGVKDYNVIKFVFDKSGRTIEHSIPGKHMTWGKARSLAHEILDSYEN